MHVTGSSVTGSSVTGSNVLYMEFDPLHCYSDLQLCHSFVYACARILFTYIMATSRKKSEVWEQGSYFSPWKGELHRGIGDYFVVSYLCKVITISHRKASQIASPAS